MSTTLKTRESNFELCRIVLMLLVLLIHYIPVRVADLTGGYNLTTDTTWDIIHLELNSLAFVCVNSFVLISGYFGIRLKIRSFLNFIFQLIFWSAICILLAITFFDVMINSIIQTFLQNIVFGWFPEAYLILFVVSPILNAFIKSCTNKELGYYILLFYLLSTIGGYLMSFHDFNEGMSALSLIGLYLIGAYLKETDIKLFTLKAKYNLIIYFVLGFCLVIFSIIMIKIGVTSSLYGYLNPVIIVMSIYLFLFFKKINIGYCKSINYLSASAFSIYLFHYNPIIFGEIRKIWQYIDFNYSMNLSLLLAMISFVAIFLFCVAIDRIRIFIFNHFIERYIR